MHATSFLLYHFLSIDKTYSFKGYMKHISNESYNLKNTLHALCTIAKTNKHFIQN